MGVPISPAPMTAIVPFDFIEGTPSFWSEGQLSDGLPRDGHLNPASPRLNRSRPLSDYRISGRSNPFCSGSAAAQDLQIESVDKSIAGAYRPGAGARRSPRRGHGRRRRGFVAPFNSSGANGTLTRDLRWLVQENSEQEPNMMGKSFVLAAMILAGATGAGLANDSGAAAGAATGAVSGAIVGGPVGAVVGGAAGAAVGGAASGPNHHTTVIEEKPSCSSTSVTRENEFGDRTTVRKDRC
jgi:hypothetical protein